MLFDPTPPSFGILGNGINSNIGSLRNQGLEIALEMNLIQKENFSWGVSFNYSNIFNVITRLKNSEDIFPNNFHIIREGSPISTFYGFEWAGVNPANGNPMWRKADGSLVQFSIDNQFYALFNPDNPADLSARSTLAQADRKILGQANPLWFGGLINNFKYKNFSLELFLRYSGGNYLMNITRQESLLNQSFQNNGREILQHWTTEGQITNVPKLAAGVGTAINNLNTADSRFLEKADFLRVQNIILIYDFSKESLLRMSSIGIQNIKLYCQVQNPFIFTKYSGLDPEISISLGNATFGLDQNANPIIRTYTLGFNIGF